MPDVDVEIRPGRIINLSVNPALVDLGVVTPRVHLDVHAVIGGGGGASALDDLTDVDTTSDPPDLDDVLAWDGSEWTPATLTGLAGAGVPDGGAVGEILAKQSSADGDADWETLEAIGAQRVGTLVSFGGSSTVTTQRRIFYLGSGTVTLPLVADVPYQEFLVNPVAGPGVTLQASGSDVFPLSASSTFFVVGASPTTFTAVPGVGWIPDVRSGLAYDIPFFAGLGFPDGYVVTLDGGLPAWRDPDGLIDVGRDPVWADPPTVTTKVMRIDYAGNPGTADGAWSTDEPADLTDGVDLRCRVWFDYPSDLVPPSTDRFQEILTQEHPTAAGGDTFEFAVLWGDDSFGGGVVPGQPHMFWEAAKVGVGTAMETNGGYHRAGLKAREWVDLRVTQDFDTDTVTYWRAVPVQLSTDCELLDGTWWWPLATTVNADFGGIDTTATSDWWIGLRFTGYLSSLKMTSFDGSTTYVDINAADLDALTVGDTSFTDDAGNTWTTVAGEIAAAP